MRCIPGLSQWIGTATFLCLLPSGTVEAAPPQPKKPARAVLPDVALGKPVKLEMQAVPLSDAAAWLSQQFSVPVVLERRALKDAGMRLDMPLSHSKQYKSLAEGLTALLQPVGITWVQLGDVILLTTRERAETILDTRVYQVVQPLGGKSPADSVMTIRPQTWTEVGGPACVREFGSNLLIISQTADAHAEIGKQFAAGLRPVRHADLTKTSRLLTPAQLRALASPVDCEFVEAPLVDVLEFLSKAGKVTLNLDKKALLAAGVGVDAPITLQMPVKQRLSTVLGLLLSENYLTWVPDKKGLLVTTGTAAQSQVITVAYNVADLTPGGSADALTETIQYSIGPTTWTDVGGVGSIAFQPAQGTLEVKQSFGVQQGVEQFLADVRAALGR